MMVCSPSTPFPSVQSHLWFFLPLPLHLVVHWEVPPGPAVCVRKWVPCSVMPPWMPALNMAGRATQHLRLGMATAESGCFILQSVGTSATPLKDVMRISKNIYKGGKLFYLCAITAVPEFQLHSWMNTHPISSHLHFYAVFDYFLRMQIIKKQQITGSSAQTFWEQCHVEIWEFQRKWEEQPKTSTRFLQWCKQTCSSCLLGRGASSVSTGSFTWLSLGLGHEQEP